MHFVLYTAFISKQNVLMVMFYTPINKAERISELKVKVTYICIHFLFYTHKL